MTIVGLRRLLGEFPALAVAVGLAGCWAAPIATVQPKGEARLIQGGIAVESVASMAVVKSVDRGASAIVVQTPGAPEVSTYKISPSVSNFEEIKAGDTVQATLAQELTVYVLRGGQAPGRSGTLEMIAADARVLTVDPSYRLLTLQFPGGRTETLKIPIAAKLRQMETGDSVVIRTLEVVALRRKD
jgi:hypothetical protein